MIVPPPEFRTARLRLRVPSIDDADAIFSEYAADPDVTRYMTWQPHTTVETVSEFLKDQSERIRSRELGAWVLTLTPEDRAVGMLGARIRGHSVDIGYVLGRRYWNRGYMPEAITVLSDWLLLQPGIFRVWAVCDVDNVGSARALEKSRFEREGRLRRWIRHPNLSSEPRDCFVYARVR